MFSQCSKRPPFCGSKDVQTDGKDLVTNEKRGEGNLHVVQVLQDNNSPERQSKIKKVDFLPSIRKIKSLAPK
jgi:hypothetical protein